MQSELKAKDFSGRVILSTDRVRPIGDCHKTDVLHNVSPEMFDLVASGKYFGDINIESDKLIVAGGFNWHPCDLQIERQPIILPPIEPVTFNIDNLVIEDDL